MIEFSSEAMKMWNKIPLDIQRKLLCNVICSKCNDMVEIVDFKAIVLKQGDLLLNGKCKNCSSNISRLIEGEE